MRLIKIFTHYQAVFFQFVRMNLVGVLNTLINIAIFNILYLVFDWHYIGAQVVAYFISLINSYVLNKQWAFKYSALGKKHELGIFIRFFVVNLLSLGITLILLSFMIENLGIVAIVSQILITGLTMIINFFGYKHWVFQKVEEKR